MITLAAIRNLQQASDAFEQNLWYEEYVDGHTVVNIFPETEAFLAKRAAEGKQLYMFATHGYPHEEAVIDFFLAATTVETLGAILVAADLHAKLFSSFRPGEAPRYINRSLEWFIAPVLPAALY